MQDTEYKEKKENYLEISYNKCYSEIVDAMRAIDSSYYDGAYHEDMKREHRMGRAIIKNVLNFWVDTLFRYDDRPTIFIFPFDRFTDVCGILRREYNIFTFASVLSPAFRKKGYANAKTIYYNRIDRLIYKGYLTKDISYTKEAIRLLKEQFQKNQVKLIILGNDWTFIERAIAIAGAECEVPVVVLQHGVYLKDTMEKMHIGKYADIFWCWSNYVKDCYEAIYHPPEDFVQVVGYPYFVEEKQIADKKRVLFAGNPYSLHQPEYMEEYTALLKTVITVCNETGLEFVLRIHPGESREYFKMLFSGVEGFSLSDEADMEKDVTGSALVVGDTSSVLLQAQSLRRRAIQIVWNKEIAAVSQEPLYRSFIKVSPEKEAIKSAILDNVGQYSDADVSYELGECGSFWEHILAEAKRAIADSATT